MSHEVREKQRFFYFVDKDKYETESSTITGAQIKAAITNFDHQYGLFLEGQGQEPDRTVSDTDGFSLELDKGPRRFYTVPPATFGQL